MNEYVLYSVLGLSISLGLYFLGKRMYRKHKIHKDYNRSFTEEQTKLKNELAFLRKELLNTNVPEIRNEYLRKIDLIVSGYKEKDKVE